MIKRIINLIMIFSLLTITPVSSCEAQYYSRCFNKTKVYILESSPEKINIIKEQGKIKSLKSISKENKSLGGINASFYNMKNRHSCGLLIVNGKLISKNIYNRPYIVIGEKTYISDSKEISPDVKLAVGGGNYLLKNGKRYITNNHFTNCFVKAKVRRTIIGINNKGKILLVVIMGADIYKASNIMLKLGAVDALALDGGTSSQMYYNGNYKVVSKRIVPVVITMNY